MDFNPPFFFEQEDEIIIMRCCYCYVSVYLGFLDPRTRNYTPKGPSPQGDELQDDWYGKHDIMTPWINLILAGLYPDRRTE